MLDHVSLGVSDIARSRRFYDAALRPLGLVRIVDFRKGKGADYGHAPGSTGVESTDTGIATTIVGSTQALPTPFNNSLQNSTSNVENLYDIPATVAINLPTGQLPGIAGTPNSAIGYWGYTDGFGNGFYYLKIDSHPGA